jgi:hypothetical protein
MSDGDGTDPSTRVPTARGAWVHAVMSCHARHLILLPLMGPALSAFPSVKSLLGAAAGGPGIAPVGLRRGFVVGR